MAPFDLRPGEWLLVGSWTALVVLVNKAVIHDTGSTWPMLVLLGSWARVALVHLGRRVRTRSGR